MVSRSQVTCEEQSSGEHAHDPGAVPLPDVFLGPEALNAAEMPPQPEGREKDSSPEFLCPNTRFPQPYRLAHLYLEECLPNQRLQVLNWSPHRLARPRKVAIDRMERERDHGETTGLRTWVPGPKLTSGR